MGEQDPAAQWDDAYGLGDDTRSGFQQRPAMSLRMLDGAGVSPGDSLVDVGGGASPLAGALLDRSFRDVTVLDIAATEMQHARRRLDDRASQVQWVVADVLTWQPDHRYQAWHDRAVFHFLATGQERQRYKNTCTPPPGPAPLPCSAASPQTDRNSARACR